ncbi:MAG TPA: hypothetical protein VEB86_15805, partial [Chryseosolibacter sp.]|nr:hypothetical protein [Chryseosolibacter sp.]
MARTNITYRHAPKSRTISPVRQLLILLLTVIFGVLISVSVNAQKATVKNSEKKKARVYKLKNRARANHYAEACEILSRKRTTTENLPAPGRPGSKTVAKGSSSRTATPEATYLTGQQHIIREMVMLELKERKNSGPIELAPVYFTQQNDQVSVGDVNPFLIAVEFALQGRTIEIQSGLESDSAMKIAAITTITTMMKKMCVPEYRNAVTESATYASAGDDRFYLGL